MKKYRLSTRISVEQWSGFIENHPQGNVFQGPGIFGLFEKTNNYKPLLLAVLGEKDEITGLLSAVIQKELPGIAGYFSSRAVIWGGPLIAPAPVRPGVEDIVLEMLLNRLIKCVRSRTIYIQVRNLFDMDRYMHVFQKKGFRYREHLNYIVETADRERTRNRISKSKMRQVRKSLETGAKIIEPAHIDQVRTFYKILKNLYKTRVKRPLPPWPFFKTFFEMSRENRLGKYFLVEFNNKIIGGIMCPVTGNRVVYEWYVCGLDGEYKGVYPSVLATWAPIDYALRSGLEYFDFMGAGKPDQDYGVREFKAKFGGEPVEYGRFERINNKPFYLLGKWALKALGALKK